MVGFKMKYAIRFTLGFIVVTQLSGCSIRMFNIGDEHSQTDRVDSIGYYDEIENDTITKEKDK